MLGDKTEATDYQGWKNYETWNVMLYLDNEEPAYRYYTERVRKFKAMGAEKISPLVAKSIALSALGSRTMDGVSLKSRKIDWTEIAESMMEN